MKQHKLGAFALSGLIIGPILGSGILILPPLVYSIAKDWAILAWVFMIMISFIVAFIFGSISIRFPGDGGTTIAIAHVFGPYIKRLAAFYLIIGVTFGASAVLLTAGQYVERLGIGSALLVSCMLLPLCIALLLARVNILGKIAFALSVIAAIVLFLGGAKSLIDHATAVHITTSFDLSNFSYALLILFWAIFGWEVIGNYSADVVDPKKTIARAIYISILTISAVDLVVVAAVQWARYEGQPGDELTITSIIYSLFGSSSHLIMAILALFLCCSTYFLYVGGISRLVSSLAEEKIIPQLLAKRSRYNVPYIAILLIFILNLLVFLLVQADVFNLEKLVAFANSFLTANALTGIMAGVVLIKNKFIRISGIALSLLITAMLLLHSTGISLMIILALAFYYAYRHWAAKRTA